MIHQYQVWGEKNLLTSVEKKGMKDRDNDAKSEDWNLGNF